MKEHATTNQEPTPEQLRVEVAGLMGWRVEQQGDGEMVLFSPKPDSQWVRSDYDPSTTLESFSYLLPAYEASLDACAEMERSLGINEMSRYADALEKICVPVHVCPLTHWMAVVMATPLQRCEAFIATKKGVKR